jgi:hypothetical protein
MGLDLSVFLSFGKGGGVEGEGMFAFILATKKVQVPMIQRTFLMG